MVMMGVAFRHRPPKAGELVPNHYRYRNYSYRRQVISAR